MKTWISLLISALMTGIGCTKKEPEPPAPEKDAPAEATAEGTSPTAGSGSYLGAIAAAQKSAQGNIGIVSIQQAIQFFRTEEARNPGSLQELVQKGYLTQLPKAPYNMKYVYDPRTGLIRVAPK